MSSSSDYYSILGVTPAAETVVIRAAYRALMRHYHPDTNPDPEAQKRAREITAAFAVLGDPARRAEYDAERAGSDELAIIDEPLPQRPPPAMRGAGIALATVALALVVTVFVWPQPEPPRVRETPAQAARPTETPKTRPIEELEPESARLARLHAQSGIPAPQPATLDEALVDQPPPAPAISPPPVRIASVAPRRAITQVVQPRKPGPAAPVAAAEKPKSPSTGAADRLTTLNNMAAGFFSQSMAHADAAKKELLLNSHTRSATTRKACHSDSCVTQAYLRQMREISAIMEGKPVPEQ